MVNQKKPIEKIILVVPEYPPLHIGGGGVVFESCAQELVKNNYSVTVFSGNYTSRNIFDKPTKERRNGVLVIRFPLIPYPHKYPYLKAILPPNLLSTAYLFFNLVRFPKSVIHLHGYGHLFVDAAAFLIRLLGKQYYLTIHGFPKTPGEKGGLLHKVYKVYGRYIGIRTIRGAKNISCLSPALLSDPQFSTQKEGVIVIPNGVDDYFFENRKPKTLNGTVSFAVVGRYFPNKGYSNLLHVFSALKSHGKIGDFICNFMGDDFGIKTELQALAKNLKLEKSVFFLPHQSKQSVRNYYRHAHGYILSSLEESFGIATLEAMAQGCLAIVSQRAGVANFLHDMTDAVLYNPEDSSEKTAEKIEAVFTDPVFYRRIRNEGIRRAESFRWNRIIREYLLFYEI